MTPDVVLLVPGFLGFSRLGNFYYFAERVIAVLRGALEARVGYAVPVVPCSTLPTSSLKERQGELLKEIRTLDGSDVIGPVERFHLVGHSTGGVDAQLLTCTRTVDGGTWSHAENDVRRRIRSVVTISAPHYGTCLANSGLARFFQDPIPNLAAVPSALRAIIDLGRLATQQVDAAGVLQGGSLSEASKFLIQLLEQRDLVHDLQPATMQERRAALSPDDPAVPVTCFATASPPRNDIQPPSDAFYADIYALTRDSCDSTIPAVDDAVRFLRRVVVSSPEEVIHSTASLPLPALWDAIDPVLNDGIVNTARQVLVPWNERRDCGYRFGGLVIADHGDVLGHYDRRDALAGGQINAGLFHSGAGFRDDEFFLLYQRVAAAIRSAIP